MPRIPVSIQTPIPITISEPLPTANDGAVEVVAATVEASHAYIDGGHERRAFLEQLASDLDEAVHANRIALAERGRAVSRSMIMFVGGLLIAVAVGLLVSVSSRVFVVQE